MGLEIFNPLVVGGIKPNINLSGKGRVSFTSMPADSYEFQSLDRFTTENFIKKTAEKNPQIKNIIQSFNPEMLLNMEELQQLLKAHAKDTQNIANEIVDNLPLALRSSVDRKVLQDAAYLHDLGKVLIPKEILNKPAKLTSDEHKIMDTHAQLGYELLKNTDINPKVLNLVKNHHSKQKAFTKLIPINRENDLALQILSTADKYSALTEKRVYRDAMTPEQALTIIYEDVKNGDLSQQVFMALAKAKTTDIRDCVTN